MEYIAGWDGGGTKTICEVRSLDGQTVERFTSGPLNPNGTASGQTEGTAGTLLSRMAGLPGGLEDCRMLCIGTAGISNPDTAQRLRAALQRGGYHGRVCFTGDQQTALYGALGGPGGAVLIAGTGSICYGQREDGREARAGGWGSLMDDEGGGYALGRDILAAVVRAEDGRATETCLRRLVMEYWRVADMPSLMRVVYAPDTGKKEIASLAPLLTQALECQDGAAVRICDKAAAELALLASPVIERLELQEAKLALMGSILVRFLPVREAVIRGLGGRFPLLRLVSAQQDAATGAVLLAKHRLECGDGDTKAAYAL